MTGKKEERERGKRGKGEWKERKLRKKEKIRAREEGKGREDGGRTRV